jgi:uncharacterized glyoxalase superfamily protein PhnB
MAIHLKTVGIIANDMSQTLEFYRTLGLAIPPGSEQESNVNVEMPNGIVLGFLTAAAAKEADPNFQPPVGQTINLQFLADSPADVDAVYHRLLAASYASYTAPWDAFWGQRFARVADPDGRIVNIYAHL